MSETAEIIEMHPGQVKKDLYEIGEIPPLGHVPKQMYGWVIRRERHGEPETAMEVEVVDTPTLDSHDVLVMVMAAGVNYNGVWAALGQRRCPMRAQARRPRSAQVASRRGRSVVSHAWSRIDERA